MICNICPRCCGVDRSSARGFCGVGAEPVVAKASLHMWEEPCISGTRGSGAVFFSGCNLKCVYCQNYDISQELFGRKVSIDELAQIYYRLQEKGAHNINLVNPSHYTLQIRESLIRAKNLIVPVVYNTNSYETVNALKAMEGHVQVYLPDLKYIDPQTAEKYSGAADYFDMASAAIMEMYRQVEAPKLDEEGIIQSGLIIRHLILPGHARESMRILDWISANLPREVYVSLMSQYMPYYKTGEHPEIDRRITRRECDIVVNHLYKLGLENGYVQERESASEKYIPDFNLEGLDG